eukprot:2915656-Prymnesium_polylepis.1
MSADDKSVYSQGGSDDGRSEVGETSDAPSDGASELGGGGASDGEGEEELEGAMEDEMEAALAAEMSDGDA